MFKILKMTALVSTLLVSGCVVVDPSRTGYVYGGGGYYGGAAYYSAPPVRVYRPVYYAPPPRVIVVRERPYRSNSYRRSYRQGQYGR